MTEPYEIRVIVKCPECEAYHYDWIAFDPTLPFTLEEFCADCEDLQNEYNKDIVESSRDHEISIKEKRQKFLRSLLKWLKGEFFESK